MSVWLRKSCSSSSTSAQLADNVEPQITDLATLATVARNVGGLAISIVFDVRIGR